jgi:hypothetical protein
MPFLRAADLSNKDSKLSEKKTSYTETKSGLSLGILTVILAALFLLSAILNLGYKISLGITALSFSSPSMSIAEFEVVIGLVLLVAVVLSNLYFYGGVYLLAVVGIAEGLLSTDVQGLARNIHEMMVPFAVVGWVLIAIGAKRAYETKKFETPNQRSHTIITVLQFFVGGLVTLGWAAYARSGTYPVGTELGLIHLAIGITGVFGGYAFLRKKTWSRSFLLWINVLTIAYSAFAETLAEIYAYLPPGLNDALIGTLIAIVVSAIIIWMLGSGKSKSARS